MIRKKNTNTHCVDLLLGAINIQKLLDKLSMLFNREQNTDLKYCSQIQFRNMTARSAIHLSCDTLVHSTALIKDNYLQQVYVRLRDSRQYHTTSVQQCHTYMF